ncbi:MAG: DNA repair exonuclease, partial [Lachnospiraceae bacterium]|nr:DNA repair exonuclease [Lachnospiraceae bacterium]
FDTPEVSRETLGVVMACITKNQNITFIYLPGNHEQDVLVRAFKTLPENLKVFNGEKNMFIVGNVVVAHADKPEELPQLYPGDMNVVMYHGEMDAQKIKAWAGKNINYMALGHYHSYSEGVIDSRGIYCYSGCLEGRGFDECGPKGFVLLELDKSSMNRYFVPAAIRTVHEIVLDVTGLRGTENIDAGIESLTENIPREDMLKIVLKGTYLAGDRINVDFLQRRYSEYFFAVRVDDSGVVLDIPEKDYRLDKSLKGEFIRQVMESDLSEKQKQSVVSMGLSALAGEKI